LGIPISTTHTIAGSIIGVGTVTSIAGIKWKIAFRIIFAWVLTIPASAAVSIFCFWIIRMLHSGF
jgi:inorganic phosphate transporter, PiT family